MREIKFRAWNGEKFYSPIIDDGKVFRNGRCYEDFTPCSDVVQQYTGLKDKNGVEIYEGDIVAYTEEVADFHHIEVMVKVEIDTSGVNIPIFYDDLTVIGNIYENPELLD